MPRRRNLLLWIAFASIPLTAVGIVLAVAQKPGLNQAQREIKKIQLGMTIAQVRAAIGKESSSVWALRNMMLGEFGPGRQTMADWYFRDGSAMSVSFADDGNAVEIQEFIRASPHRNVRIRDALLTFLKSRYGLYAVLGLVVVACLAAVVLIEGYDRLRDRLATVIIEAYTRIRDRLRKAGLPL